MATKVAKSAQKYVKRILMAKPTHFQLQYSINPWMNMHRTVDKEKAMEQWNNLKNVLEECGAQVDVLDPVNADRFPDIVFTANAAVLRGKLAYMSNFFHPERKGERFFYEQWFKENGYETISNMEIPFEGAGDALWAGENNRLLVCGVGPRTDVRALDELAKQFRGGTPFKVIGCRLVDPRFYHIDTCFCPLVGDLAMWYPHAFEPVTQHNMKNELELLPVPESEAANFACNAVVVGQNVVMNVGNVQTADMLSAKGFSVKFVDMSEFIKSGGSSKCCTLAI